MRDEAVVQIAAELRQRPAGTIDAIVKLCQDARKQVLGIPENRRVGLLLGMADALGFGREDLRRLLDGGSGAVTQLDAGAAR